MVKLMNIVSIFELADGVSATWAKHRAILKFGRHTLLKCFFVPIVTGLHELTYKFIQVSLAGIGCFSALTMLFLRLSFNQLLLLPLWHLKVVIDLLT